jgi:site-specific DNA-methyltransferase (adenine-specific)
MQKGGIRLDNTLYYGDNLDILRKYIPDESVDLIYLDPPFNSKANYNILYKEVSGEFSDAQITAFEDTWHWGDNAEATFTEIIDIAPANVVKMMIAFRSFLGSNDMMAYLAMMCIRLIELRRVLKDTGSIYLHCDPTASHYLKILMDAIFGKENFRNEITWEKIKSVKAQTLGFGNVKDSIFLYVKSNISIFNQIRVPHDEKYLKQMYRYYDEDGRRYRLHDFTQTGQGQARKFGAELLHPPTGKHWIWSQEKINEGLKNGLIVFSKSGMPQVKRYLDEVKGKALSDLWNDINPMGSVSKERLGYPTQKPESLLERIIQASSKEGDIILDPFCGCGTTVTTAQKLNRNWIGIDITHLAINIIKLRLKSMFGIEPKKDYKVIGEPEDLTSAIALASQNRYQFQWWATSLIDAKPYGDKKKGKDTGIDGFIFFMDKGHETKKCIVSVKSGNVQPTDIRDLIGVLSRENASIGVFITLHEPSSGMTKDAVSAGYYRSQLSGKDYPKIQILTIEELLKGIKPKIPNQISPFKKAEPAEGEQLDLVDSEE